EWGLRTVKCKRVGGGPLALSGVYTIFSNLFYAGIIELNGKRYPGKHEPLVTVEEFDRVQRILRNDDHPLPQTRAFTYTGLIKCGECGLSVTAEEKINRHGHHYTYYHCTKSRRQSPCPQRCIQAGELETQILRFLEDLSIPDRIHDWALKQLDSAFA